MLVKMLPEFHSAWLRCAKFFKMTFTRSTFIKTGICLLLATAAMDSHATGYTAQQVSSSTITQPSCYNGLCRTPATVMWNNVFSTLYYSSPDEALAAEDGSFCPSIGGSYIGIANPMPVSQINGQIYNSYDGNCGKTWYGNPDYRGNVTPYGLCPAGYIDGGWPTGPSCAGPDHPLIQPAAHKNLGGPQAPFTCQNFTGFPIHIGTGNKYLNEIDFSTGGLYPLTLVRSYNSQLSDDAGTGVGWQLNWFGYAIKMDPSNASNVLVNRPDGKGFLFNLVGGLWVTNADVTDKLENLAGGTWRYTTSENDVELYDVNGALVSITNRAGWKWTITTVGITTTIVDSAGRSLVVGADSLGNRTVTVPDGGLYSYHRDANNNLSSVTYPDGKIKTYFYGETAYVSATPNAGVSYANALTGIVDENGVRYATYSYDAAGLADAESLAGGADAASLSYQKDNAGNITTVVTDALNTARTYHFITLMDAVKSIGTNQPGGSGCGAASSAMTYDANGNVASRTDFNGNVTTYLYDLTRNLETSRTEASGTAQARTITTVWDANFRLADSISEPGRTTTYTYDTTSGNVLTKTITDTASNRSRTWTYTYTTTSDSTLPNLLKTVDGSRTDVTDVTSYGYYPNGDLKTITDALGHVTTITSYDGAGRPLTITDPNGVITTLTYKPRGWLASRKVGTHLTSYTYDGVGNLTRVTLADGSHLDYTYDAAHRLTDIADAKLDHVHYTLDNMGNHTKEDVYDQNSVLTTTRSRTFDALNRLYQDIRAYNSATSYTTTYGYDNNGNLKQVTDAKNNITKLAYDALDRVIQSTDAASGVTKYAYDGLDQLNKVTDPRTLPTSYTVDALANTSQLASPDSGTSNNTFDDAGNLLTSTDARSIKATYAYDALNRPMSVTYPNSGESIAFTWDSGTGCTYGIGRICSETDSDGSTTFAYDDQGNLVKQTRTVSGVNFVTQFVYDLANRLVNTITPTGETLSISRDAAGLVSNVTDSNAGATTKIVADVQYNGTGQTTSQTMGNTLTQSTSYDLSGQTSTQTISTSDPDDSNDIPTLPQWGALLMGGLLIFTAQCRRRNTLHLLMLMGLVALLSGALNLPSALADTLQYDQVGNIVNRSTIAGSTTYAYDALNRLISEAGPAKTQSFTYDADSNRLSDGSGNYTYNSTSNKMATRHGTGVTYDAAGNVTADGLGHTFTYNQAGRLYQVLNGSTLLASYYYDYKGQRTRKVTTSAAPQGAGTTFYHYDEWHHLIGESAGNGAPLHTYVWRDDTPAAQIDYVPARRIIYIEADQNNTPRAGRDQTGTIVWQWNSDAFGSTTPTASAGVTINLRFPGQYFDIESGLNYNLFRDYDPKIGRYQEPDPIGLNGGMNEYGYALQNPLSNTDLLGLEVLMCSKFTHPHTFLCVNGNCSGKYPSGNPLLSPGVIKNDSPNKPSASCSSVPKGECDQQVFEQCVQSHVDNRGASGDNYNYLFANCGQWAEDVISQCRQECVKK